MAIGNDPSTSVDATSQQQQQQGFSARRSTSPFRRRRRSKSPSTTSTASNMSADAANNSNGNNSDSEGKDLSAGSGFYVHYEAKEVIGKGMSSTVRRCIERKTGLEYAVKILDVSTEKVSEEQAEELRASTLREIRILRTLSGHKNIIQLHDFYESPTFLFIVFELAKGGELFDYMTEVVTLSEKKTRHIMRQLMEAVHEMHSRSIVHRDLKPENILMMGEDLIKVTDFGFAQLLEKGQKLKELVGTPGYLAPEILRSNMYEFTDGYGLEVDLWAAGVTMYTLLAGYAPFFHRKQIYMLRMISEGRYEFRSPEWDEISAAAKDLIKKLLVVEPSKRLTAKQALAHPYLAAVAVPGEIELRPKFEALKRFRLAVVQVRALVRLLRIREIPLLVPVKAARVNPYSTRKVRRQIDAVAFRVYGHWVKKGREQYRDALFANALKLELDRAKSTPHQKIVVA